MNATVREALESAAGLCLSRTHYEVELEHFLVKLLDQPDSDFALMARHFGVDKIRLAAELGRSLDRLKAGNARTPGINSLLVDALTRGWTYGSLEWGAAEIRTGFAVFALVADEDLSRVVFEFSKELRKIDPQALRRGFAEIVAGSVEDQSVVPVGAKTGVPRITGGPHIFMSYRREDSTFYADYLFASLRAEVPGVHVFRDEDTLQPGMVFSEKIEETLAACDILLAVIGKKWSGAKDGGKRRIDQEDDWVRLEIAAALRLKKWVIPCLVGGAKMPGMSDLPPDLAALSQRHGVSLSLKELGRDAQDLLVSLRTWRRSA
ncbi:MAG: TIR domain-containing protein [Candidatus Solibacter sp.]